LKNPGTEGVTKQITNKSITEERRKIMKKKGLLIVLVVAIGLALTMGPAHAACTIHEGQVLGFGVVPGGPTLAFIWDEDGTGLVYTYSTTDQQVLNVLTLAAQFTVQAFLFKEYKKPDLHVTGDASICPLINFGDAGTITVLNLFNQFVKL
jgi:hypothetical protein